MASKQVAQMATSEWKSLGKFNCKDTLLNITDPCYEKGVWCARILRAHKGAWAVDIQITAGKTRPDFLRAYSLDMETLVKANAVDIVGKFEIAVDSGQLGIFELSQYKERGTDKKEDWEAWYHSLSLWDDKPSPRVKLLSFGVNVFGIDDWTYPVSFGLYEHTGHVGFIEIGIDARR